MNTKIFGLFGSSGFAREVMPIARDLFANTHDLYFVEHTVTDKTVNGFPVLSEDDFFNLDGEKFFNIAIAEPKIRQKIAMLCLSKNITPLSLHSPSAASLDHNRIGDGAIMTGFTTLTSNITIGQFFHANIYSYIGHDCVIGDYVTFAPRVSCNGNVHIHDHAYIGTGAVLKQGTPDKPLVIGEGAIIGMGAVVTKDVPPHTTVVGNPAKPIER